MKLLKRAEKITRSVSLYLNWLSAAIVLFMMLLTCLDIVLRYFRHPIPGTYELIGFAGALVVSFSLAHTSLERGHIAVDFLFIKLSEKMQVYFERINTMICIGLFGMITRQSFIYALSSKDAGEVSMTLQLPLFPFILGVSVGCGLLCVVLILRLLFSFTHQSNKVL